MYDIGKLQCFKTVHTAQAVLLCPERREHNRQAIQATSNVYIADAMPSPQKDLQLLEDALKKRQFWQNELEKHRTLLSCLSVLAKHTDQLCLQHAEAARYSKADLPNPNPKPKPKTLYSSELYARLDQAKTSSVVYIPSKQASDGQLGTETG